MLGRGPAVGRPGYPCDFVPTEPDEPDCLGALDVQTASSTPVAQIGQPAEY
jgi:hypothetical protein